MKKIFLSLFISLFTILSADPVVIVELPGLLGNRLFAYCVAKIIAENMEWKVYCNPIWGFPDTYPCMSNIPSNEYPLDFIQAHHDIDINSIIQNKTLRNIKIQGYFQRYAYLKPYKDKIRNEWLKIDNNLLYPTNENDIVVHVRTLYPTCYFTPFEYYQKALDSASYDRVYICTDDPNHPFLQNFLPYNPIIISTRNLNQTMNAISSWEEISKINLDDFLFIYSFKKIICSFSTYSWWAAFLSKANEIYAPYPTNKPYKYGKVEEARYHYIETKIGL